MNRTLIAVGAAALLAAACSTNIRPQDETIQPSKVRLGQYQTVVLLPLTVERSEGDSGDQAAVARIDSEIRACMRGVFGDRLVEGTATKGLLVEPSIVDLKKVNVAERFWVGPMAGSSAVLLKVKFTDSAANDVVAEPVFYAKANAWGGAFSFAATDNLMLTRIANNACDYARTNY